MTASELLQVIRRDIGQRLTMELGFSLSNHYAANVKGLNVASKAIEQWIDGLMKDNLSAEDSGYSTDKASYSGTRSDWQDRCYAAEARLEKIREALK